MSGSESLNTIPQEHPIFDLFSPRGRDIFFPKQGILSQSAEAKSKKYNATIGVACEEDQSIMSLHCLQTQTQLNKAEVFPYASSYGLEQLRQAWKHMIQQKNPSLQSTFSTPVVTSALTHALSVSGYLFVGPEETIITPDLYWGNYRLIFQNTYQARLQTFETFKNGSFNITGLLECINQPTNRILLNFPNNPTGYTLQPHEVEGLIEGLHKKAEDGHKIVLLIDDAYFGLVYEENVYTQSLFARCSNLHENILAVKIDGATKEDYAWGLRVGFISFGTKNGSKELYDVLEDKAAGAVRATISSSSHHAQSMLLHAYTSADYTQQKYDKYQVLKNRYETVKKVVSQEKYKPYFSPLPFNSGYFMCVKIQGTIDSEAVRQHLLKKYDTGVIALKGIIRIAYSSIKNEDIETIFENIYKAHQDLEAKS